MKRKLLLTLCSSLMLITCVFGFAACGGGGEPSTQTHTHTYEYTVVDESTHKGICSVCGNEITGTHSFGDGDVCTVCGYERQQEEQHQHTYSAWTEDVGEGTHSRVCTAGDDAQTEPHAWDSGEVTTPATCTEQGVRTYTCTACGATKTEDVPLVAHTWGDYTYDEENHTRTCSVCNQTETAAHTIVGDTCSVCGYEVDYSAGLTYTAIQENGETVAYSVTGIEKPRAIVVIPDTYKGLPVTQIAPRAFYEDEVLRSFTFGENVEVVEYSAFYDCTALEEVTFSDALTQIGSQAFGGCTSLKEIVLPDSVTTLEYGAFFGCTGVTRIVIGKGVTEFANSVFSHCTAVTELVFNAVSCSDLGENSAIFYCLGTEGDGVTVTIGEDVTRLPDSLFYNGRNVADETIANITTLNFNAADCADLEPYNYVFANLGKNGDGIVLTIGEKVQRVPAHFSNVNVSYAEKPSFVSVEFAENAVCESIGANAFSSVRDIKRVSLADSVERVEEYAFATLMDMEELDLGSVKEIGDHAFSSAESLTSLTLPEGLETIGMYAFAYCEKITSVVLPDSVTTVGRSAFKDCLALTSVTIGEGVKEMGKETFAGATLLTEINFNAVSMEDAGAAGDSSNNDYRIFYDAGTDGDGITVTIGSKVKEIPARLFMVDNTHYPNVTTLIFEEGSVCERIGERAFLLCVHLGSVALPASVTTVEDEAFMSCNEMTSLTIGENVSYLGNGAFSNLIYLEELNYNAVDCELYRSSPGNSIFKYLGTSLSSSQGGCTVNIGENVRSIPDALFAPVSSSGGGVPPTNFGLPNIIAVNFEEGSVCERIGEYAFYAIDSLTAISIPESVTEIGASAFYHCSALSEIEILSDTVFVRSSAFTYTKAASDAGNIFYIGTTLISLGVATTPIREETTSIADSALSGQTARTELVLPSALKCIGASAFSGCTGLTEVVIPEGVTQIGASAFNGCKGLTEMVIPASVTSIEGNPFTGCANLTSVTVAEGGHFKVKDGTLLSADGTVLIAVLPYLKDDGVEYVIPEGVTTISGYAFYNLDFAKVTMPDSVTTIGEYAFYANISTQFVFSENLTTIGKSAFYMCRQIETLDLSAAVEIGQYAFSDCTNLTSVLLGEGVMYVGSNAFPLSTTTQITTEVFYCGSQEQWNARKGIIKSGFTIVYYSEEEPPLLPDGSGYNGRFWYYGDQGEIVRWEFTAE